MNSSKNIKLNTIASNNIFLYFVTWLLYMFTGHSLFFIMQIFLGFLPIVYCMISSKYKWNTVLFIALLSFVMIISNLISMNFNYINIIINLHYPFLAILLVENQLNVKLFKISFWTHALIFTFLMLIGMNPNYVFVTSSRNYISVIMLIQVSLLYISYVKSGKKITILPAIVTVILSFWAVGRSGIGSSVFLLIGLVIYTGNKEKYNFKRTVLNIFSIFLFVFILTIAFNEDYLVSLSQSVDAALTRFKTLDFTDDARFVISNQYIDTLNNPTNFIFGTNLNNIRILQILNNNLHNSYLGLHAIYGIGGFILYSIGIIYGILKLIKNRSLVYFFVFIALLIRMFTDTVAFPGVLDPLIIYFVFQEDLNNNNENKLNINKNTIQ